LRSRLACRDRMLVFTISIAIWCLLVAAIKYLILPRMAKRVMGEGSTAIIWYLNLFYVKVFHRLKAFGNDLIPDELYPGKIVVVCNHQSPIDPLLVQSQCRFKIRWLMASEYMKPSMALLWKLSGVIPIARDGHDTAGLRTALRHLKQNGVIGIFPEGGIKQPRHTVHPFEEGVGAMIAKTHAKVLLFTVDGTPPSDELDAAFSERSYAKVRCIGMQTFKDDATPIEITSSLQQRISEVTGWPLVD